MSMTPEQKLRAWWRWQDQWVLAMVGREPSERDEPIGRFYDSQHARAAVGAHNQQKREGRLYVASADDAAEG